MKKYLVGLSVLVLGFIFITSNVFAVTPPKTINSILIDGSVSVNATANQSIVLSVNATGHNGGEKWDSTKYTIEGSPSVCVDHSKHDNSEPFTEVFNINAPITSDSYDITVTIYDNNNCTNGAVSSTLINAIIVSELAPTPTTAKVTIVKYINGVQATAESTNNASFPMTSSWTTTNVGSGTGNYTLSASGYNNPNPYQATTTDMNIGADYSTHENTGTSCISPMMYSLVGYSTGDTLTEAEGATVSTDVPTFTNLQSDKFVIVWNKTCLDLPVHLSPADNSVKTSAEQTLIDWSDVTNWASPITYMYQSALSMATNMDGSFTSPAYTSGTLTSSEIPTPGTPEGVYYWHVKAMDGAGNDSGWTTPWKITIDNTPEDLEPSGGNIQITKYDCPEGITVVRSANGVDQTVPEGCIPKSGKTFGYVYGTQTDANALYPELSAPVIAGGSTDENGVLTISNLVVNGRYLIVETNPENPTEKLPHGDVLGLYCIGDGDTSDNNDNQELTFVTEGGTTHCVAYDTDKAPDAFNVSPSDGAVEAGASLTQTWGSNATDISYFIYESYHDALGTSLRWTENVSGTNKTATNVSDAEFWWRVKAVDLIGNMSDWTPLWKLVIINGSEQFQNTGEITSPTLNQEVSGIINLTATYNDGDEFNDDTVNWAVRKDSCSTNNVFGNVDGFNNPFNWDGKNFSAVLDTTILENGTYCFVFNPTDDAGQNDVRETLMFTVNNTEPIVNGTLIVKKIVVNNENGTKTADDFSFKINGGESIFFNEDQGNPLLGENSISLAPGTYTITENDMANYAGLAENCTALVIASEQTATCTFTNDDFVHSGGSAQSFSGGVVAGASTEAPESTMEAPKGEVLGATTCSAIYLNDFIYFGKKNNPDQVKLLQTFLNEELGLKLVVDGKYGRTTRNAVITFQEKYGTDILAPWAPFGLKSGKGTGTVYKTTKWKINMIKCADLKLEVPQLP